MKATKILIALLIVTLYTYGAILLYDSSLSNVEQLSENKETTNARNLKNTQLRFMYSHPTTNQRLTALVDMGGEVLPDILFCFMKTMDVPSDITCLFIGELIYDEDGNTMGNVIYEKKMN